MRQTGAAATATVRQAQLVYTPADLGWNVLAYGGGGSSPVSSNVVQITGYGSWSIYVLVSALGNSTLTLIAKDEDGPTSGDLTIFTVSATVTPAVPPAYRHFTFGPASSTVPLVADWVYFKIENAVNAGNVTMRIFGRAY